MANNRLYLVHVPTRVGAFIGKRMGWGYYLGEGTDVAKNISQLYEYVEHNAEAGEGDEFAVWDEDACIGVMWNTISDVEGFPQLGRMELDVEWRDYVEKAFRDVEEGRK